MMIMKVAYLIYQYLILKKDDITHAIDLKNDRLDFGKTMVLTKYIVTLLVFPQSSGHIYVGLYPYLLENYIQTSQ